MVRKINQSKSIGECLMKSVQKLTLIVALGAFAVSMPVMAQKANKEQKADKGKKAKEPVANYSKEFVKAYTAVDPMINKKDFAGVKAQWPAIKASIKNEDDRQKAGVLAYTTGSETKDSALMNEGLDLIIASKATQPELRATALVERGKIFYIAKDYSNAEISLKQAYDLGDRKNNVEDLISSTFAIRKNYQEALNWMELGINNKKSAGAAVDKQYYSKATVYAAQSKNSPKMIYWGQEMIKADPRPETYHDAIFNFIFANRTLDVSETLDTLRLARQTKSLIMASEYKDYIEAVDVRRFPAEALSVMDEGFAKGVISKTNTFYAEHYATASKGAQELRAGWDQDEKTALASSNSYDTMLFGENMMAFTQYARAQKALEAALSKGVIKDRDGKDQTDRARMRLGIVKAMQGNFVGAKADFQAMKTPNRKQVAEYWLIYLSQKGA
jgi:tetratricopeptide (TPR) repeat protein